MLRQKCELGLLDPGWRPDPEVVADGDARPRRAESRAVARELAERSLVLLHNDGTLRLRRKHRLAVIGPRADDPGAMLGCYSFPSTSACTTPTPRSASTSRPCSTRCGAEHDVGYARGCPVGARSDVGPTPASTPPPRLPREADVCVLVLGDQAGLFGGGTSGEGCDAPTCACPAARKTCWRRVLATGTPVVLVLLSGRPYDLSRHADRLAADPVRLLPRRGGRGRDRRRAHRSRRPVRPAAGRLPARPGAQPGTYLGAPLALRARSPASTRRPLFPFGHGLSLRFTARVAVEETEPDPWATDGTTRFRVELRNDGDTPGDRGRPAVPARPGRRGGRARCSSLIGVRAGRVEPGTTRVVAVELHADLSLVHRAGRPTGSSSPVRSNCTSACPVRTSGRRCAARSPARAGSSASTASCTLSSPPPRT